MTAVKELTVGQVVLLAYCEGYADALGRQLNALDHEQIENKFHTSNIYDVLKENNLVPM